MAKKIVKDMLKGNEDYMNEVNHEIWENIKEGQKPKITMVCCSDSRVGGHIMNKDLTNHVFHIRNIGNQISNSEGSIDYGVLHCRTPVLLVLGHTDCGAIKASLADFTNETAGIIRELASLSVITHSKIKEFGDNKNEYKAKYTELNVDEQVKDAMRLYKGKDTTIVGAVYDIHNVYGAGNGAIIVININGVRDAVKLKEHEVLSELEDEFKEVRVKRLT
ncbi:hypothetical protein JW930_07200 [Candidatus Woesearchaeota archaeon]|nr:hypothetical protein [Candidatus Woesearchaeota archaeon]